MEYRIVAIKPSSQYIHNKYYPMLIGRECDILELMVGTHGWLLVDMLYDPGRPHRFRTTPVLDIQNKDDGTVIFTTENSVYTLVAKNGEESNT